jgi:hypothetical protein
MPAKSDFVIELPWLRYNPAAILTICQSDSSRWRNKVSPRGNRELFQRWPIAEFRDHQTIRDVLDQVESKMGAEWTEPAIAATKFPPQFHLAPHLDYDREGAIMFPLIFEDLAPIHWYDQQGKIIYTHHYNCPSLIRTQILHSVINRSAERIVFEMSFFIPWSELVSIFG